MKTLGASALAVLALARLASPPPATAEAVVGETAPAFTLVDTNGKARSLADYEGKTVVLEWWNYQCPFVNNHYSTGHMQELQKAWTKRGVVWLVISSSGAGKQGYVEGTKAEAWMEEKDGAPTAVLLDHDGTVGRAWGARTTPHMFIVDPAGTVVYAGGIDDTPSTDPEDLATAHNYVQAALEEVTAGQPVTTPSSEPYGCGVKYAE